VQPSWEVKLESVDMCVLVGDQENKMEDFSRLWVLLKRRPHRLMQVTRVRVILRMVVRGS